MLTLQPMRAVLANAIAAAPSLYKLVLLLLVRGAAPRMAPAAALAVLTLLAFLGVSVRFAGARFVLLIILIIVVAVVFLVVPPFDVVFLALSRLSLPLLVLIVVIIIGVVFAVLAPLRLFGRLLRLLIIVVFVIQILPQIFQCLELVLEYILLLETLLKSAPGARVTLSHRLLFVGAAVLKSLLDLLSEIVVAVRWVVIVGRVGDAYVRPIERYMFKYIIITRNVHLFGQDSNPGASSLMQLC
jgi:hypothetical protein